MSDEKTTVIEAYQLTAVRAHQATRIGDQHKRKLYSDILDAMERAFPGYIMELIQKHELEPTAILSEAYQILQQENAYAHHTANET